MPTQPPIYGHWRTALPGAKLNITMFAGEARPIELTPDDGDSLSGITDVAFEVYSDEDEGPLLRKTNTDVSNPITLSGTTITIPLVKGDTFTFSGRMKAIVWDETVGYEKVLASGWFTVKPNPDAAGVAPTPVPVTFPFVPLTRTITINGVSQDLSANRSWTISVGGGTWGSITGTLSSQTDLQSALDAKATTTLSNLSSVPTSLQNLSLGNYANGSLGATPTIDWTRGVTQTGTLTANCTLAFTAPNKPGPLQLVLTEDGTGSHTIALPGNGTWMQGFAPPTIAATLQRVLDIIYDGATYFVWYSPSGADAFREIVTSAGTTQLVAADPAFVLFTGSTTHTVYLPDTTTPLFKGYTTRFVNSSTANVLVRASDGTLVGTVVANGGSLECVCNSTSGTSASAWTIGKISLSSGVVGTLGKANGGTGEDNSTGGTANTFFARPAGGTGAASFRAIVAADVPSLATLYLSLSGGTVAGDVVVQGDLDAERVKIGQTFKGTINGLALTANRTVSLPDRDGQVYLNSTYTNTATLGATPTLDLATNPNQSGTLTANCTFTFADPTVPCDISILLTANATGGYTMAWPGNVIWDGGVPPRTVPASETIEIGGRFDGANHRLGWKPFSKDRLMVTGTTAPADADMANETAEFHVDSTSGNAAVIANIKDAGGTVTHQRLVSAASISGINVLRFERFY